MADSHKCDSEMWMMQVLKYLKMGEERSLKNLYLQERNKDYLKQQGIFGKPAYIKAVRIHWLEI